MSGQTKAIHASKSMKKVGIYDRFHNKVYLKDGVKYKIGDTTDVAQVKGRKVEFGSETYHSGEHVDKWITLADDRPIIEEMKKKNFVMRKNGLPMVDIRGELTLTPAEYFFYERYCQRERGRTLKEYMENTVQMSIEYEIGDELSGEELEELERLRKKEREIWKDSNLYGKVDISPLFEDD